MADLLSTSIAGTLNVSQGASVAGNLFVSNIDIIPEINKYTRTLTDLSFDSIQGWYPTSFDALSLTTALTAGGASVGGQPEGLFVKPDGTQLYVIDSQNARLNQFRLPLTYNVASAVYEGNLLVSGGETAPTDLFFSDTGRILYVIGQAGDAIDAYDLTTSWNVFAGSTLVAANGFSVASQTTLPKGMFLNSNGKYLYVASGATTDRNLHQYTLSTNWNVATASFTSSYNVAPFTPPIDFISAVSLNPSGTKLYALIDHDPGFSNNRAMLHEFNLSTPYILSTATYSSSSHLTSMFNTSGNELEDNPTGFFLEPTSNIAYFVGSNHDKVRSAYAYRSTSVANSFVIEGKTHIRSGLEVNDASVFNDTTFFIGAARFGASLTSYGSCSFLSGINGGGGINYNGSLITTGDVSIGVGTGNSVYEIGYGATLTGNTKNVRIGTGGTAGSLTNILIGPSAANATINVFANTTTFSNSVDIRGQLTVSGLNILNEISLADNLARVSANSGSIQSAVALNFVNTSTIRVSVGAGEPNNANISLDYIGSVSGGSGINNFPVSANSGSTATANGLNFVNTSTTTINVSADSSGNANVSITSKAIQTEYNSSVYSNKQMMEWVHNRDGNIFSLGSSSPVGIFANTSGTRFYIVDSGSDSVKQLNLSEAWNIASATTETANLSVSGQDTNPVDLFIKSDGSVLYVLGDTGDNIISYPLSESWNVRSAGAATESTTLGTGTWTALFFKEDGSKMYVGNTSGIVQFSLGTNWDVSTRTLETSLTTSTIDSSLQSLSISPDGNFLYIVGGGNDRMYELKMSESFNVATAVYNNFYSRLRDVQTVFSSETAPTGMFVAYPNSRMYIVGTSADTVIQYEMDEGITLDTKKVFANGRAHFMDDVFVVGDVIATEALKSEGTLEVGSTGQFSVSGGGGVTAPAITISGATTLSGSITTSGNNAITMGAGIANTETNVAIGATTAGNTKNVRIGTGGVAGSITNITIGTNSGGDANVIINANTVTISNTVSIGNQLVVSGLNILNEIGIADNLARVSANSGSIQSAVALNFINTATVQVSVTPGETGFANIALTSSGSSGVTSVDTGLGLTGGPITSTGTISANIASTTVQGITKLIDSVTSTDAANAATANSVKLAYDLATIGANTTSVSANSGSLINDASLNFNNTATIQVSVTAGVSGNANVSFNSHIANGSITSAATISPLRTGPHNHYAVTALATAATIEPPEVNTGKDGDRLTLRIQDNGTGRGLTWNTAAGAYRAIGVTLPTTTVATKVLYIGSIYNSTDNFWDVVAYVVQA